MGAKQTAPLVKKHHENEVTLREQNLPLICCQPVKMLIYFEEVFRSLHEFNVGSVDQIAAKLLAFNVGGLKKSLPTQPESNHTCASLTLSELFSKFDGRQLCSPLTYKPYINCIKRSKPLLNTC